MKIEILSVDLLKSEHIHVQDFLRLSQELEKGLGWHYLLDLSWVAKQLDLSPKLQILDAGAGIGLMQFWIAEKGIDVISADRDSRAKLPNRFRQKYRVKGWRKNDLDPYLHLKGFLPPRSPMNWHLYPVKLLTSAKSLWWSIVFWKGRGTVYIYNQDLSDLADIPNNSIDAVVSVSALEHNSPTDLRIVVTELMRVLKSGGKLIATLSAAKDRDWFHEPSKGWCYTESTLRKLFDLPDNCQSNYNRYDEMFVALQNCSELRENLSAFYSESGNNGMPWGIWNPKYQPVGILKVKN